MNLFNCHRPRTLALAVVASLLSACAGGAEPLRPAGRPVEVTDASAPAAGQAVVTPAATATVEQSAPSNTDAERQRLAMVDQYQELVAEIRELRDMVERQQFDLDTLNRSYGENMRFMRERLAAQQATIDRLSNQTVAPQGSDDRYAYNNANPTPTSNQTAPPIVDTTRPADSNNETRTPIPLGTPEQAPAATSNATGTTTNTGLPQVTDQPTPTTTQPTGAAPNVANLATSAAGRDQYDAAFELLKQSRYEEAVVGFEAFIRDHGNTELADDAQYWVGEANYVTRDFDAAVASFQAVVEKYPTSTRAGDAMLKIGYIQYESGDYIAARNTLNKVVRQYPGSRVSSSATAKMEQMTKEGH